VSSIGKRPEMRIRWDVHTEQILQDGPASRHWLADAEVEIRPLGSPQTLTFERAKHSKVRHERHQIPALGDTNSHFSSKLLKFGWLCWPLWIRRVLVHPNRWPSARAQEGQYGRREARPFSLGLGLSATDQGAMPRMKILDVFLASCCGALASTCKALNRGVFLSPSNAGSTARSMSQSERCSLCFLKMHKGFVRTLEIGRYPCDELGWDIRTGAGRHDRQWPGGGERGVVGSPVELMTPRSSCG
jgi:hypothetical protein